MGWASGSDVFNGVWAAVREHIPEDKRAETGARVIRTLVHEDWDTLEDISDAFPEKDAMLEAYDPCYFYEED